MNDYLKVVTVIDREVDKYLKDGWEIIDTTKEAYGDGGYFLKYHLGLSTRSVMMKYKNIIESYEEFGFKEQLFEKVAESNGERFDSYTDEIAGFITYDKSTKFMEDYEKNVHDKIVRYYREGDKEAILDF